MTFTRGSELAKNRATSSWMKRALQAAVLVAVASSMPGAWAAGGSSTIQVNNVAAGSATISQAGSVTTIRTATPNTIINYQRMDVYAGQTLQFWQPTSTSRVLNRIQGPDPTTINGTITSNGIVYLVNPAGVMFGPGSVVNAAQFFAAGSHLSDQNFLSGVNQFTGSSGAVTNYGTIQAGQIHLVGSQVANFGQIVAGDGGVVTMTAGKDVLIGTTDSPVTAPRVYVKVSSDSSSVKDGTGVTNAGTVRAAGGQILLGAGDVYAAGIYSNGSLLGKAITLDSGASSVVVAGTIDATSGTGKGGTVTVVGQKVTVSGTIDVSGAAGGGTILVGGDVHGSGAETASDTEVGDGAVLRADAWSSGDGGKVVVWADHATIFSGNIYARALGPTGDGGNAEVSGKVDLLVGGHADLSSIGGHAGMLVLDPGAVGIISGPNATTGQPNTFNDGWINAQLTGSDVTISTANGNTSTTEDLTVNAGALINWGSSHNLVLVGNNSILVSGSIQATSTGGLTLTGGTVTIGAGGSVVTSGGAFLTTGSGFTVAPTGSFQVAAGSASTTINHPTGVVAINGFFSTGGGSLSITAASVSEAGTGTLTAVGGVDITTTGAVDLTLGSNTFGKIALANSGAGSPVTVFATGGVTLGVSGTITTTSTNGGDLTIQSTGTLKVDMPVTTGGGNLTLRGGDMNLTVNAALTAGAGTVAFESTDPTKTIGLGNAGGSNMTIDPTEFAKIVSAGKIRIGANGTQSGQVTVETLNLSAVTAPVEINSNAGAGGVELNDGNTATALATGGALTIQAGTSGITATHAANAFAEISSAGVVTLSSGAAIGTSSHPIQFAASQTGVNITTTGGTSDVFVGGLGDLTFGAVTSGNNLTVTTATGSGGNIQATGVLTAASIALNADGGIGSSGTPVQISLGAGTGSFTTSGNGPLGDIFLGSSSAVNVSALLGTIVTNGTGTKVVSLAAPTLSFSGPVALVGQSLALTLTTPAGTLAVGQTVSADNISLTADNFSITAALSAPTGTIALAPFTPGTPMTISGLPALSTATSFQFGSPTTGALSITAPVTVTTNLTLEGATVTQTPGSTITAVGLAVVATGNAAGVSVSLPEANVVGTFAANSTGGGSVSFTNSIGFTVGTVGTVTGVSSGGQAINLTATTGSIVVAQNVNAGAGNATLTATANNITDTAGTGVVTGGNVDLEAANGVIGAGGAPVKTASTTLLTVTANGAVTVAEANALSTDGSRLNITQPAAAPLNITAASIDIPTSVGSTSKPVTLTTTVGGITNGLGVVLSGDSITLVSAAGIGTAAHPLEVALGLGTASYTTNGNGAAGDIFLSSSGPVVVNTALGTIVTNGTGTKTVSLAAPAISFTGPVTLAGQALALTVTTPAGTLTVNQPLSADSILLTADNIAIPSTLTATGTIGLAPFSTGTPFSISGFPVGSTASTFKFGNANTGTITLIGVGGVLDLSGAAADVTIENQITSPIDFNGNKLQVAPGHTLTIIGSNGVLANTFDFSLDSPGGTVVFQNVGGDIGSSVAPFFANVANLGGATGAGSIYFVNIGALHVTGAVNLTGGSGGSFIEAASPLTISAPVSMAGSFTLEAGNNALAAGDDLTVAANVTSTTGGTITLIAGDNVFLNSGQISTTGLVSITANNENSSTTDGVTGGITQLAGASIVAGSVDTHANTGILLDGTGNQVGAFSASNANSDIPATGEIRLVNTGAAGVALALGAITQDGADPIRITATGAVTQTGAINVTSAGANLIVKTLNASGASITLNQSNNLGAGLATLLVHDALDGTTVSADVAFTTSGVMHIQRIQSGANVTLSAGTTINQDALDPVGIVGTLLTVNSTGAITLDNTVNSFSALNATDNGASLEVLKFVTTSASGLAITGLTQGNGGTVFVANTAGAVTSTAAMLAQFLHVEAVGGISLTNPSNTFQSVQMINSGSGDITVVQGTGFGLPLDVNLLTQSGGGATFLTSTVGVVLDGTVSAGSGLTIKVPTAGQFFSTTATAAVTVAGDVSITADSWQIDPASTLNAGAHNVVLKPFTPTLTIALEGVDNPGVAVGFTSAKMATITATKVTLGAWVAPADPGNQTGDITLASGTFAIPTTVGTLELVTTGNVDLSGGTINTTPASGTMLVVRHDGTFHIFGANIDGGLTETAASGAGAGGLVTLSGALNSPNHAITFNSEVASSGASVSTLNGGVGGADISFAFAGTPNTSLVGVGGGSLTLDAGTGSITFAQPIGVGTGNALGMLIINSANNVTLPATTAFGENITNTGTLAINGLQTLGSGGFVQLNATGVTLAGDIVTGGTAPGIGAITLNSPVTLSGNRLLDTTAGSTTAGASIVLNGVVTGGANNLTLTAGVGFEQVNAALTTTGTFNSSGVAFQNSAPISASSITLNQTGVVVLTDNLTSGGGTGPVDITGAGVLQTGGIINADNLTLRGTGTFTMNQANTINTLAANVTGPLTFVNANSFAVGTAGTPPVTGIATNGGAVNLTASSGSITLLADVNAGAALVQLHTPTILGADATVTGTNVTVSGTITGAHALIINASGLTKILGDVGTVGTPLTGLTTDSAGSTSLGGSVHATTVSFGDPLTLTANAVVVGSTVSFSTITGGGLFSLDVTGSTSSTFNGTVGVGLGNALTTFHVHAGGTASFAAPTVTTTGAQTYDSAVSVSNNASFTGTTITFNSSLIPSVVGDSLGITATGPVTLAGPTGSGAFPFTTLTVTGATSTTIGTSVNTSGDISVPGPVTISGTMTSASGNVAMPGAISLGGATAIVAGGATGITLGAVTGPSGLTLKTTGTATALSGPVIVVGPMGTSGTHLGALEFDSAYLVRLGGDIYATTAKFAGSSGGALATSPLAATVSFANGNLLINTNGTFDMEQGQKLSVFDQTGVLPGNLSIISNGSPITIGDLSAKGVITVNAGVGIAINVVARPPGSVLKNDGTQITDKGTDIVSGVPGSGGLVFTGTIKLTIPGNVPPTAQVQFASADGQADMATAVFSIVASPVKVLVVNQTLATTISSFEANDFALSHRVLDLYAFGVGNPVNSLGTISSQDLQLLAPDQTNAISGALRDALRELGIFARDPSMTEILDYLIRRAMYDELPYKFNPGPQDTQVVSNSLPYSPVIKTVDAYRDLFLKPVLDENGNPVLDENGQPKMQAQDTAIRNALGQAWQMYMSMAARDQATPERFRAFLEALASTEPKAATALNDLNKLRDLLNMIKQLGLTDTEFEVSKKVLLAKVRPANIKESEFYDVVMGPTSRAQGVTALK